MYHKVEPDQFKITPTSITHVPTNARCSISRNRSDATVELGALVRPAPDRERFNPGEVLAMMDRLWAQHLTSRKLRQRM